MTWRSWCAAVATVGVAVTALVWGRGSLPQPGQTLPVAITIVPSDADDLACASAAVLGDNLRCAFDQHNQPSSTRRPLRPFVTTENDLLLIAGVFESSRVGAWLSSAHARKDSRRVTLDCQSRILGTVPAVGVRWGAGAQFDPASDVLAADITDCGVPR